MASAPSDRPRLREPGLLLMKPGIERYRVKGGGTTTLALNAGDEATIIDIEGRQPCELVVLSRDGKNDAAAVGFKADGRSEVLASLLQGGFEETAALLRFLNRQRMQPGEAPAVRLFSGETRPLTQ